MLNLWGNLNQKNPHLLLAWRIRQHWVRKRPPGLLGPILGASWWPGLRCLCWEFWQTPDATRRQPQHAAQHFTANSGPSAGETRSQKNDHMPQESKRQDQGYHQHPQSMQQQRISEVKIETGISPCSRIARKLPVKQLELPFCHL